MSVRENQNIFDLSPNVPYPCEVNWQIGHGNLFLNTNLFFIKPFLITKFDCIRITWNTWYSTSLTIKLCASCFLYAFSVDDDVTKRRSPPQKNFRHQQISRGCFANSIFKQTKDETSLKDIFFDVSVHV